MYDEVIADPKVTEEMRLEEKARMDMLDRISRAEREANERSARNLLKAGVDPQIISSSLGLSLDGVLSLK